MKPSGSFNTRRVMIVIHDLVATAIALVASFYIRFEDASLQQRLEPLLIVLPGFVAYAGIVYWFFSLYRAKWRFASLPDLFNIFRAVTVLAVSLLVIDYVVVSSQLWGTFFLGKVTIIVYWFLQMFVLGGPRIAYRYFRYSRTMHQQERSTETVPVLALGRAADAEVLLRAIESGAVKKIRAIGILSPAKADQDQSIRGVSVLGDFAALERCIADLEERGTRVARLVLTQSALQPEAQPEAILMRARRLGLSTSRLPSLDTGADGPDRPIQLAPIDVEDLLLRPSVTIDYHRLESFLRGKRVVVTGGGGSIGADICDRVVTFGAAKLMVIENCEPALHGVQERLEAKRGATEIDGRIADIRDRERLFRLLTEFAPDIVFHAAALKHVPILERDWAEGVRTNVFGSVNVADAAAEAGASAMVMISTDKAIEPVSMLGLTKRFAEMYCQALDADAALSNRSGSTPMRLIAVRFGNVLASTGSVVPKFKAQIEAGGPVTVTHPDMVRYFMTIREACDLVATAVTHALGPQRSEASVYVLNMGQPVRIVDLAERMIRLTGLEPGRDIEIAFTGIRPGERLREILFASDEPRTEIGIPGIVAAKPVYSPLTDMRARLSTLEKALKAEDAAAARRVLSDAVGGKPAAQTIRPSQKAAASA